MDTVAPEPVNTTDWPLIVAVNCWLTAFHVPVRHAPGFGAEEGCGLADRPSEAWCPDPVAPVARPEPALPCPEPALPRPEPAWSPGRRVVSSATLITAARASTARPAMTGLRVTRSRSVGR